MAEYGILHEFQRRPAVGVRGGLYHDFGRWTDDEGEWVEAFVGIVGRCRGGTDHRYGVGGEFEFLFGLSREVRRRRREYHTVHEEQMESELRSEKSR